MITIQIKLKELSESPAEINCNYSDLWAIINMLEKSKTVQVYNVSSHGKGFLKWEELNMWTMNKWIDKSFSEYFGDD